MPTTQLIAATAAAAFLTTPAIAQKSCSVLSDLQLKDVRVVSAQHVDSSVQQIPATVLPAYTLTLPASCRVKLEAKPTPDSAIGIEVWLPEKTWNGIYVQAGNGGLAGSISYPAMLSLLSKNYAVAATDDGHTGGGTDGTWAINHPEKVKDFAYRAVHVTRHVASEVIASYYSHPAGHSYFNGCSEGGREALMEAQRFPEDFDGIVAGAPAMSWMQLMAAFAWNAQATLKDPASYIPVEKRQMIGNAVLAQCGKQFGVESPFVQDPLHCRFDPGVLRCKQADDASCLTDKQITALHAIYGGARSSSGAQLSPGYAPGGEGQPGIPGLSYDSYMFGPQPGTSLALFFSSAFYGDFVFSDPKYSSLSLNFGSDLQKANALLADDMDVKPNLNAFHKRGGKLLHYHGWEDGSPSPLQSVDFYNAVRAAAGGQQVTDTFYRMFMVPGMMHCGEGPGPNMFGNLVDTRTNGSQDDDILLALRGWVEQGRAPESIAATKFKDDDSSKPVVMSRPLCAYPKVAIWKGKGDTTDAKNFSCRVPKP